MPECEIENFAMSQLEIVIRLCQLDCAVKDYDYRVESYGSSRRVIFRKRLNSGKLKLD